ncbi:MAG: alkyl sulfatase dimerization domain-containing protein [Deltaproteobacteria bacterium]
MTSQGFTAPSKYTISANAAVANALNLDDPADAIDATFGRIAQEDELVIRDATGRILWDARSYAFVQGDAPASVNPSLWRQEKLNNEHGLFKVKDGIYQVRGYDLANMSIIEGDTGWILIDPLGSEETAAAAIALARKHLGEKPIRAILFTHSHIDHFGGIGGILSGDPEIDGQIRLIAPKGFVAEATSENILAGTAMGRRATFMYGFGLERSPRGHIGSGLGKEPARGTFSIAIPTESIDHTGQKLTIDGVDFTFQYTPESEAPAEFLFYLPQKNALFGAEVVSRNMHNVLTLRGAKARDALKWSGYIDETIRLFPTSDVLVNSHHWPVRGRTAIRAYLEGQRDTYKFIHDQTLRLANEGMTPREIADALELPESLGRSFANRGYYGTTSHNARAVYQRYFGFYDGNPANLNPLPPTEEAIRFVAAMGGEAAVLTEGQRAFDKGDYRWAARVLNHLVFADPQSQNARTLLAATYDQLGYQAESAPWRDVYLSGALELRIGKAAATIDIAGATGMLQAIPIAGFFDAMAVRIDADKIAGDEMVFNFVFTDLGETHVVEIKNSVLNHRQSDPVDNADATIRLTRDFWLGLVSGNAGVREMVFSDEFEVEGSRFALLSFLGSLTAPPGDFAIVTP